MTNPTVLIIEDDAALRSLETRLARRAGFQVETAHDGPAGLAAATAQVPDVIISDFHMPGMKGPELLRRLREIPALQELPILVVTGDRSEAARRNVLQAGADDVIIKPFPPAEFRRHLMEAAHSQGLRPVPQRGRRRARPPAPHHPPAPQPTGEIRPVSPDHALAGQLQVVLAAAMERPCRADMERTRNHIRRVRDISSVVARAAGVPDDLCIEIEQYAGLHDVGKSGLPDHILRKPDLFTSTERQEMETHVLIGADLLHDAGLPDTAVVIARHHHERWDGRGYPQRLAGERIPLAARIVAVADVYDALRSSRSYRPDIPVDEVEARMRQLAGTHLDPMLVEALFQHRDAIDATFERHRDPSSEPDLEVWR